MIFKVDGIYCYIGSRSLFYFRISFLNCLDKKLLLTQWWHCSFIAFCSYIERIFQVRFLQNEDDFPSLDPSVLQFANYNKGLTL